MKNVWIDITNSPHVVLFNPIIKEMKKKGYKVTVTARDYAQTKGLLDMYEIDYIMFGKHMGKSKFKKLIGLIKRSLKLYKFAKNKNFDASLSMSSQYCMIASKFLKIPHMTLFDYEYSTGHHINFRLSDRILSPKGVGKDVFEKFGANMEKVVFFDGLKEQFYIDYYLNNDKKENVRNLLNIPKDRILITMRPEATMAHYQTNENPLSFEIVEFLNSHKKKPIIVVIPRVEEQRKEYEVKNYENVIIPDKVINGIDLVVASDLVIGAGGTVNREAAAVGTPVYTIYKGGKMCAVDRMLINSGKMVYIDNIDDFKNIEIQKKDLKKMKRGKNLTDFYLKNLEELIKKK